MLAESRWYRAEKVMCLTAKGSGSRIAMDYYQRLSGPKMRSVGYVATSVTGNGLLKAPAPTFSGFERPQDKTVSGN